MERVSATLALHHDLTTGGGEEVGSLVVGGYLEFLNAFKRRRDSTSAPYAVVRIVVVALQIAGDIATVQHVGILIAQGSGNLAAVDVTSAGRVRSRGGLQGQKRSRVAVQVGNGQQHVVGHRAAHRCVLRL